MKKRQKKESTLLNKVFALVLILVGIFTTAISMDGTALLLILMFAIPLFFAKDNWIDL